MIIDERRKSEKGSKNMKQISLLYILGQNISPGVFTTWSIELVSLTKFYCASVCSFTAQHCFSYDLALRLWEPAKKLQDNCYFSCECAHQWNGNLNRFSVPSSALCPHRWKALFIHLVIWHLMMSCEPLLKLVKSTARFQVL